MLGKNNVAEKINRVAGRRQRFAIRKLTVGAASVLIGSLLWLDSNTVQAAKADADQTAPASELVQPAKALQKKDAQTNEPEKVQLQANAPQKADNIQQKALPVKAEKASISKSKDANELKLDLKKIKAPDKLADKELRESKVPVPNKVVHHNSAFIMKHGGAAIGEHDNVDVNGGYDENVWGKLNVNDWDYQSVDDPRNPNVKLKIKDYKGKAAGTSSYGEETYHIIVPNSVDLINAGLLKKGEELGVDYLNDTVTVKDVDGNTNQLDGLVQGGGTYAISKTGNGKLVLLNNTFIDPRRSISFMIMRESSDSLPFNSSQFNNSLTALTDLSSLDTHNITKIDEYNSLGDVVLPNMVWDLSGWDMSHVTDLEYPMLAANSGDFILKGLDLSGWNLSNADPSKWTYNVSPILLWSGSGKTLVDYLDLSNVKLPKNWPAYYSASGEIVKGNAWISELKQIFGHQIGGSRFIPAKYLNFSGDDFTGLTSEQVINYLNNIGTGDDSAAFELQGLRIFANNLKGIPELPQSIRFDSAYQPIGSENYNSIPYTADNGHGTKVRIYTDNDNLLKSFGSGNYAEMKAPVASGKRTIIFNLPTGRQTKTQTVAFKNKPIYIDNDAKTIHFVVAADDPADGKYPAVNVPQVAGYKASITESKIAAADAKPGDNIIITVDYVKKPDKKDHQDDNDDPSVAPLVPAGPDQNDPSAAPSEPGNSAKSPAQADQHQSAANAAAAQAAQQLPAAAANRFSRKASQARSDQILQLKTKTEASVKQQRAQTAVSGSQQPTGQAAAARFVSHHSQLPQTGEKGNALARMILGLALLSLASGIALLSKHGRKHS